MASSPTTSPRNAYFLLAHGKAFPDWPCRRQGGHRPGRTRPPLRAGGSSRHTSGPLGHDQEKQLGVNKPPEERICARVRSEHSRAPLTADSGWRISSCRAQSPSCTGAESLVTGTA
jgi:hypothetical protein